VRFSDRVEIESLRRVLITGAGGFIGRALPGALLDAGWQVRCVSRAVSPAPPADERVERFAVADIASKPDWNPLLEGVDTVVHLAAVSDYHGRAGEDAERTLFRVNVDASLRLASQAARAGVRRLVFLSTIKVLGESTAGRPFSEKSEPAPQTLYARSKLAAERGLLDLGREQGLEVAIIRPCLVFGPGARGSMLQLMQLVARGFPLPLAGVDNRRSLVALANLCDLVRCALDHPRACEQILLAADEPPVSTAQLVRQLAGLMKRPARLFPAPVGLMRLAGTMTGKQAQINSLLGSLAVDASETRDRLDWTPPLRFEPALASTVNDFLAGAG
jgi:nucleoside-diphosphate-sugar epimerase